MSLFNIFDLGDNRYTAQVVPECYPHERQPALKNWSEEEREAYCGVYTSLRRGIVQLEHTVKQLSSFSAECRFHIGIRP